MDNYRMLVGYSEDYEENISEFLRASFCPIVSYWQKDNQRLQQYIYAYKCSTTGGMSGAPILFRENDKYKIIGIHTAETLGGGYNRGIFINHKKFERIIYWIANQDTDPKNDEITSFL